MTRSQKIRRFFDGDDRNAKVIQLAYAKASLMGFMSSWGNGLAKTKSKHFAEYVKEHEDIIDLLERQIFILDNRGLPFEIRPSLRDINRGVPRGKHRLYRVILADEEEALYVLTRSARTS